MCPQVHTYGILEEEYSLNSWVQVALISDVSCDKEFVDMLIARCAQGQLSPLHLLDVVLDALP